MRRNQRRHSLGGLSLPSESKDGAAEEAQRPEGKGMVVAVRIRPLSTREIAAGCKSTCEVGAKETIVIRRDTRDGGVLRSQAASCNEYAFDSAFGPDSSQQDIYNATAKPFIPNLLKGLHVTVFAYGATGAGKTHTMLGNSRVDDASMHTAEAGIIPQAVHDLFSQIESKQKAQERGESWTVSSTFVEIYNEQVYDLLTPGKPLSLREDTDRGVVVCAGVKESQTRSAADVMSVLAIGNKNRKTEATMANAVSSRSHAVLQLCIKQMKRSTETGRETSTESKLSLIDLAGSERASATNNRGARLHEGANINKSLLALANCINALASNSSSGKQRNVKYRDSRLTHLLKSSLEGGNCNLVMIANINPSHLTFEDSHNTLKYANRAKNIKVNPTATAAAVESNWMQREVNLRDDNRALANDNQALRARIVELEGLVASLRSQQRQPQRLLRSADDMEIEAPRVPSPAKSKRESSTRSRRSSAGAGEPAGFLPAPPPSKTPYAHGHDHGVPVVSARGDRESVPAHAHAHAHNPFLDAILPTAAKKRKVYESKFVDTDEAEEEEEMEIRVDVKQGETRAAAAPQELSANKKQRRSYSGMEEATAPRAPGEKPTMCVASNRRSSFGRNNKSEAPAFTIPEDSSFVASKPATQKPTAVSRRRKSLAAVSAMLDSIVNENGSDKENAAAPRRNIDLSRVLRPESVKSTKLDDATAPAAAPATKNNPSTRESLGARRSSKAAPMMSVVPQDRLGSDVWIDI